MDPTEAADAIAESAEEHHHSNDAFRNRAALVIAILAALLAVCGLGGDNSKDAMIYNNIKPATPGRSTRPRTSARPRTSSPPIS